MASIPSAGTRPGNQTLGLKLLKLSKVAAASKKQEKAAAVDSSRLIRTPDLAKTPFSSEFDSRLLTLERFSSVMGTILKIYCEDIKLWFSAASQEDKISPDWSNSLSLFPLLTKMMMTTEKISILMIQH